MIKSGGNERMKADKIMKLADYTGKLNNHNEYLKTIRYLEAKCKYIEYVLISDDTTFTDKFKAYVISVKSKNKWWGTKTGRKCNIYKLKASHEIFEYLKGVETFCKYIISDRGDIVEETLFGINDIAFFDDNEIPLLFTTTHEGYITGREDLFR